MLKRTLFASVLALYWGIGGAANWRTGSFTLTSQVSAAPLPESSELLIPLTVTLPRKLIRRPPIATIPLPSPPETTPSVLSSIHTLIQRPSVSPVPLPLPPTTTSQISVNVPSKLIRRPSVSLASATAPASTAPVTSVQRPQTAIQSVNGVSANIVPTAGSTTSGTTKPKNAAQAAIAFGSVTAPIFAQSFQSALASAPVNPIAFASVGQLSAAAQSGAASANYPRKLTQRPEVEAILAPPTQTSSPPPPPPPSAPTIGRNPASLAFTGVQGGANPSNQTLSITNTGGGILSWSVSDNATWLTLSPASGTAPGSATVNVSLTGLIAGTYNAMITVTATGATNTPQTVPVTLTVTAPPSSGTATLTWNASTSSDVVGYNVYVGTASGVYGPPINAGNVTAYQVANLLGGNTYFFAVTAYDSSGHQSSFSNEVSKSIF